MNSMTREQFKQFQYDFAKQMARQGLPEHMHYGLMAYVCHGAHVGDALRALLENDLAESIGRLDDTNRAAIQNWVLFLVNVMPGGSWGNREWVREWQEMGGIAGLIAEQEQRNKRGHTVSRGVAEAESLSPAEEG